MKTLRKLLKRLNLKDGNWNAKVQNNTLNFSRVDNKVEETFNFSFEEMINDDFRALNDFCGFLQEYFLDFTTLNIKDSELKITSPIDLITKGLNSVKKGVSFQRYKGLGEMKPDQLWETTLDPEFRSMLKVKIEDAQRANEIFEDLMGDDVEKRKFFIQSNAKKVANLDV